MWFQIAQFTFDLCGLKFTSASGLDAELITMLFPHDTSCDINLKFKLITHPTMNPIQDDSDEEDYRKANRKARPRHQLDPPPEDLDMHKFSQKVAINLMQQRGCTLLYYSYSLW